MNRSILIVDDTEFMRFVLRDLMIENGIGLIAEAGDRREALSFLRSLEPDIVTVDLTVPSVGGLSLVEAVRDEAPYTRIIAVKALGEIQLRRQAASAGADAVIVKPFDPMEVRRVMAELREPETIYI